MPDPAHGTRSTYQHHSCRCTPCRGAEAAYRQALRLRHAKGLPILGALVSAVEPWRQIRLLTTEYDTKEALAVRFGFQSRQLQFGRSKVRFRTAQRIARLYQFDILAGLERP